MSNTGGIVVVILALLAGFGGGFTYEATLGKSSSSSSSTSKSTSTDTKQTLADCLKEVWGDDKYAAITVNSSLATTEDNLAALKCYES